MVIPSYVKLIGYGLLCVAIFGAGFTVAKWRGDAAYAKLQASQATAYSDSLEGGIKRAQTAIDAAAASAEKQQKDLATISDNTHAMVEASQNQIKGIKNDIAKLPPTTCVFTPDYTGILQRISQTANSGRSNLYPAEAVHAH